MMKKNNKNSFQLNNKFLGNFLLWAIIISICVLVVMYMDPSTGKKEITYSELHKMLFEYVDVDENACENLDNSVWFADGPKIGCHKLNAHVKEIRNEDTGYTEIDITEDNSETGQPEDVTYVTHAYRDQLRENILEKYPDLKYEYIPPTQSFWSYFMNFAPWLLIIVFWFVIMKRMQGGGQSGGIFSFAKSKARIISSKNTKVLFKDVAGCEEAKTELEEIVQFLKTPNKYKKLGAKIPRGALLLGPPGTGKTLLAKAVSGEAKVPFFTISGAEFVEMFVGVGASRVRDLFEQAKKSSPSIIFIDEIDAVGRHRGAGLGGGHDEREQTLNQILVEMDGFDTNTNVILIAATNRPDVLDKALLRPGRFDRQIVVDTPDVYGREAILKIHTKKIKLDKDVVLKTIAKSTPGLSGADLENLANESALLAARNNQKTVNMRNFEDAKDKIMMGNERKSMILSNEDKKIIAYHEAGHALVAYFTKGADPVHKITIIPRGMALGVTAQIPEADRYNYPKSYLLGKIDILMGGRCAEKLIFNDTSTGAGNDIEVATNIARKMVCEWGMSDKIGPLKFGKQDDQVFLGKEIAQQKDYSEEKSTLIDNEVSKIVLTAEKNADYILMKYNKELDLIAEELISKETISGLDMKKIIKMQMNSSSDKIPVDKDITPRKRRTSKEKKS